ncbi:MAG TPA: TPM domain-containing protein [Vicinamibacterales bacterium]|nr:TPM domain-containing protein [Vicinamibacterales bacterium]
MRRSRAWLAALLIVLSASFARSADIPYLTGRVVDDAGILSQGARARLTAELKAHEEKTTDQIVVLTVQTIQPDSIEDYAVKVVEAWKIGQRGKDNGVLVVVIPRDRKMRIEVGYGLEPTLTDGVCGDIIRSSMTPAFKQGDYDRGVEDGVAAIISRLEGRAAPVATDEGAQPAARGGLSGLQPPNMPWQQRILIGAFVFGIIGLFTVVGVVTPAAGWFLYVFLIPFWAIFPVIVVGPNATLALLATYLIGFPLAKRSMQNQPWYLKAAQDLKSKGSANIGGFTITSGGSSFSSGGGGFSGGGGSSGGGGASGSW